ncbi:hypothetical protein ACJX0J_016038, partial [Zea mays]
TVIQILLEYSLIPIDRSTHQTQDDINIKVWIFLKLLIHPLQSNRISIYVDDVTALFGYSYKMLPSWKGFSLESWQWVEHIFWKDRELAPVVAISRITHYRLLIYNRIVHDVMFL